MKGHSLDWTVYSKEDRCLNIEVYHKPLKQTSTYLTLTILWAGFLKLQKVEGKIKEE